MKKVVGCLVISCFMVLAGLSNAHAEKAYWTLEAGFFLPDEDAFDTGFTLQGGVGVSLASLDSSSAQTDSFLSKVWLEGGLGYSHAEFDYVIPGFPGFPGLSINGDVDVIPVTGTVLVRQPLSPDFDIYGGVGLGLYWVMLDAAGADDSSLDLGLHIEGGAAYKVSRDLALTAELQWSRVGEDAAEGTNIVFGVRKSF